MAQRHERCFNQTQAWIKWLNTRRFLSKPEPKNILAVMQGIRSSTGWEPDGPMSAEICAFNLCVTSQPDDHLIPFLHIYAGVGDQPTKCYAALIGISVPSFYERAHRSAVAIWRQHIALVDLHKKMRLEVDGYV